MFGNFFKEIVTRKYKQYAEFAKICSISRGHLNDIFTGRVLPKEKNLDFFIEQLQPISEDDKKKLKREWAFEKGNNILREDFNELEKNNMHMLEILKNTKRERELMSEVEKLKEYELMYQTFFDGLSPKETKNVLNSILKELKIIALDNGKQELLKDKFEKLEKVIKDIENLE